VDLLGKKAAQAVFFWLAYRTPQSECIMVPGFLLPCRRVCFVALLFSFVFGLSSLVSAQTAGLPVPVAGLTISAAAPPASLTPEVIQQLPSEVRAKLPADQTGKPEASDVFLYEKVLRLQRILPAADLLRPGAVIEFALLHRYDPATTPLPGLPSRFCDGDFQHAI